MVILHHDALKTLESLGGKDRRIVVSEIARLEQEDGGEQLHGKWRRFYKARVGPWRLLFQKYAGQRVIVIVTIERRSSTTYW